MLQCLTVQTAELDELFGEMNAPPITVKVEPLEIRLCLQCWHKVVAAAIREPAEDAVVVALDDIAEPLKDLRRRLKVFELTCQDSALITHTLLEEWGAIVDLLLALLEPPADSDQEWDRRPLKNPVETITVDEAMKRMGLAVKPAHSREFDIGEWHVKIDWVGLHAYLGLFWEGDCIKTGLADAYDTEAEAEIAAQAFVKGWLLQRNT